MLQEVGVDVAAKRVLWVKARPDYEPLFSILDGLRPDGKRRYWIESLHVQEDNCGLEVDIGQVNTGVEIVMQMSCETCSAGALTSAAEQIQKENAPSTEKIDGHRARRLQRHLDCYPRFFAAHLGILSPGAAAVPPLFLSSQN